MKNARLKKQIITLFIGLISINLQSTTLYAQETANKANHDWQELTYFERHNAKIKVQIFEEPILIEWDQMPKGISKELENRIRAFIKQFSFLHPTFEDWYAEYLKYSTLVRKQSRGSESDLRESYKADSAYWGYGPDFKKNNPHFKYQSIVAQVDIQYAGALYSAVVYAMGEKPLPFIPKSSSELEGTPWGFFTHAMLKYEDGIWKNDFFPISRFPPWSKTINFEELKALLETGYAYNSIEHEGLYPFTPPNLPVEDSLRESYPGENSFRIHEGSNFDWIGRFDASLENILAGKRFTYNVDPLQGGKPYPPGFQPKRDIRSVLDFDPPPIPGEPEDTDSVANSEPESLEAPQSSQPSRPLWAYFIFAWAILATLALALIAILTLRRK